MTIDWGLAPHWQQHYLQYMGCIGSQVLSPTLPTVTTRHEDDPLNVP